MLHSPDERLETDTEVTHHWTMFAVQIDDGGSLCVPYTSTLDSGVKALTSVIC